MHREWRGNGGQEDVNCDGRNARRATWKEYDRNREREPDIDGNGDNTFALVPMCCCIIGTLYV